MRERKASKLAKRRHSNNSVDPPKQAKRKPRLQGGPSRPKRVTQSGGAGVAHLESRAMEFAAASRRERLEAILDEHSTTDLLDLLERLVKMFRDEMHPGKPKTLGQIRKDYAQIKGAADTLQKRLADLDVTGKVTLNFELLSRGWRLVPVADLKALVARLSEDVSVLLKRPLVSHRLVNYQRQCFAQLVASYLHAAGIPLTRSRNGVLAKILGELLGGAGFTTREDLRTLLQTIGRPLVPPVPSPSYPRFAQPQANEPPAKGEVMITITSAEAQGSESLP